MKYNIGELVIAHHLQKCLVIVISNNYNRQYPYLCAIPKNLSFGENFEEYEYDISNDDELRIMNLQIPISYTLQYNFFPYRERELDKYEI